MNNQANIMRHLSPSLPDRSAFTLTELLVVISTIAILVAIRLPALAKTLAKTQDLQCISTVKQLALANILYCNDNKGSFVWAESSGGRTPEWIDLLLAHYVSSKEVLLCPATPLNTNGVPSAGFYSPGGNYKFGTADCPWNCNNDWMHYDAQGSYGYNGWCYSDTAVAGGVDSFPKDSSLTSPAKTPFFTDAIWVDSWPKPNDPVITDLYDGDTSGAEDMGRFTIARHGWKGAANAPRNFVGSVLPGQNNVSFADGHVEPVTLNGLWKLYWSKDAGWPK